MKNIKYVGPAKDHSGYGECSRHDIGSLLEAGYDITLKIPRYTQASADFGELGQIVDVKNNNDIPYSVVIVHTTPDQFAKHREPGKYNIGRVIWETDKLPPDFADGAEMMDEIWTASEFNKQAIINAGVTKPIYIVPEAIDVNLNLSDNQYRPFKCKADGSFSFYSIFEWTERKNPDALLRSYWQEFTEKDNVSLVIKTYLDSFSVATRKEITTAIGAMKASLKLDYYAPVFLYLDIMNRDQIYRFHNSFDCFVSTHRGEGWGIPQMEAMLAGKPIISSNICGIHEYLTNQEEAMLVPVTMKRVNNTRNTQWYLHDQNWGDVDQSKFREAMRWVYENQQGSSMVGLNGQQAVKRMFSFEAVGNIMKQRLEEIKV